MQTIQFENAVEQSTGGNQAAFTLSYFTSVFAEVRAKTIGWADLAVMASMPTVRANKKAAALTPYDSAGKTLAHAQQSLFNVLVADLDNVAYGIPRLVDKIRVHGHSGALIIYSTYSHLREGNSNRYRVLIPLAEPVDAEAYKTLSTGFNRMLGDGADRCAENINQLFFAPNKADVTSPYEYFVQGGDYLSANLGFCEVLRIKAAEVGSVEKTQTPNREAVKQLSSEVVKQVVSPPTLTVCFESLPSDCKPTKTGERRKALFNFARYLKSVIQGAQPRQLRPYIKGWFDYFLDIIGTKDFETTWLDFQASYQYARIPYGKGVADIINELDTVTLPAPINDYIEEMEYSAGTANLIKLCYVIKDMDGVFYLGNIDAANVVGRKCHKAGGLRLGALVGDGLLEVVEKGTRGSRGKATTYRWLADDEGNF